MTNATHAIARRAIYGGRLIYVYHAALFAHARAMSGAQQQAMEAARNQERCVMRAAARQLRRIQCLNIEMLSMSTF